MTNVSLTDFRQAVKSFFLTPYILSKNSLLQLIYAILSLPWQGQSSLLNNRLGI